MSSNEDISRAYRAMKVTTYHRRMKLRAVAYKGGKCIGIDCGYSKSPAALTFRHRDPTQKDFTISGRITKWEKLVPELDKCDLLCSNCHNEEHERLAEVGRQALYALIRQHMPERKPSEHKVTPCHTCGLSVSRPAREFRSEFAYCSARCSSTSQQRTAWPSKDELQELVLHNPVSRIATSLGVSGAAVKKRCNKLGIQTRGRGFWNKKAVQVPDDVLV